MPGPPPRHPDPDRLKAQIVVRVGAGETVVAICASPGMPTLDTVHHWRRRDAAFAGALAGARVGWRAERRRLRVAFDAEVARAFLARWAAGETADALLDTPGMPNQAAYAHWLRTEPAFAAAAGALRAQGYASRRDRAHARWRGWDEAVADRITLAVMRGAVLRRLLESDPTLPCPKIVRRWRSENPEWDGALSAAMSVGGRVREATTAARGLWSPELAEEILFRIVEGGTLHSIGRDPKMPRPHTLYAWCAKRPDFEADVLEACRWREWAINDRVLDAGRRDRLESLAQRRREVRALKWQSIRLRKQPGWRRRRAAEAAAGGVADGAG